MFFGISAYHPYLPPLADTSMSAGDIALAKKADTAMDVLVKNDTFLQSLAAHTIPALQPSSQLILATLWGHFDTNEGATFGKADVQQALADGGITDSKTLNALWRQIDPRGCSPYVTADTFGKNTYIQGYILKHADTINADVLDTQLKGGASLSSGNSFLATLFSLKGGSGNPSVMDQIV